MADAPVSALRSSSAPGSAWPRSLLVYGLALVLLLGLGHEVVAAMVRTWANTTTYHHGFLVLPICLYLAWRQRRRLAVLEPSGSLGGALCLLPFGLLWALGSAGDVVFLQQLGLVGLAVALVPALMGWQVAGVLWFTLVFAFAMVPFGDELVPALQQVTAEFSVRLLRLVGIPVFHEGLLIQTPTGMFEVAEACAGLRFLIANLVVAFLFCHFSYRTWWKWFAFMALATLIPILANGLRAFGIILIAYETDNEVATGVDHLVYGWGFFTLVMLLSLFVGNLFADRGMGGLGAVEPNPAEEPAPARESGRRGPGLGFAGLVLALALAGPLWGLLMGSVAGAAGPTGAEATPRLAEADWPAAEGAAAWQPAFPAADATDAAAYRLDGQRVEAFLAYYRYQRQGAELIHGDNAFYGERWTRIGTDSWSAEIDGRQVPARMLHLARGDERRLVATFYWIDGRFVADALAVKLRQTLARLELRQAPAAALAISTPIRESRERAEARLRRFLDGGGGRVAALSPASGSGS